MPRRPVPISSTVYTPERLATAMARTLGDHPKCIWLDPCVGDGAFVAAISALGVPKERIRALDLASSGAERDALAKTTRSVDFVAWALRHRGKFDRIIMNPPYVALSRLRGKPREAALSVEISSGVRLPLKANYWCAFVLSAVRSLRAGGSMAIVLPAAWDYARYARQVRDIVTDGFGEVIVVRSAAPLFPTVLDGAVVVIARGKGEQPCVQHRIEVEAAEGVIRALTLLGDGELPPLASTTLAIGKRDERVRLGDLAEILIGGVTGDARYFLLTDGQRTELGLPQRSLRPVISRCRQLARPSVTTDEWLRMKAAGERVWLFSPSGNIAKHAAVQRYLRRGASGSCHRNRYKIRTRKPWYRTHLPRHVDGFISGMSKRLPFLVMNEMPGLSATNTLYVVRFKRLLGAAARYAVGIALLSSRVRGELASRARVYPDGLFKFEPAELSDLRIPLPPSRKGARLVFEAATALLLRGNEIEAQRLADAWLGGQETAKLLLLAVAEPQIQAHR